MRNSFATCCLLTLLVLSSAMSMAKDPPPQVITWPEAGPTVIRFDLGKLKEIASMGNRRSYLIDTTAENLWGKVIPSASFSLYLFDRNKARIGEGYITLSNVGVGETVKFQVAMHSSGVPATLAPRCTIAWNCATVACSAATWNRSRRRRLLSGSEGKGQAYGRNQVKRILPIERDSPEALPPAVSKP